MGFNPQILQSVASWYTHCAGLADNTLQVRYAEHIRYTIQQPTSDICNTYFKQLSYGLVDEM
jgi:hypothetical protein